MVPTGHSACVTRGLLLHDERQTGVVVGVAHTANLNEENERFAFFAATLHLR